MAVQERIKLKRSSLDNWSTREQLCLASSVLKSGDQNWMGVSRSLKQFVDKDNLKPIDWYSPKSCAQQYSQLLENTDTPKRKKRECGETSNESIVRRLTQERITELNQLLNAHRDDYLRIKSELNVLRSNTIKEDKLQKMWQQIEQEEREQEQKNKLYTAWLTKRQQKKDQLQSSQVLSLNVPRKVSETNISSELQESSDINIEDEEKKNKGGGRSPLLTSLLKSPSPTTQVQAPISSAQVTSPTIASLLGSSPKVPTSQISQTVSPQLHQLVSASVSNPSNERPSVGAPTLSMLLEIPTNIQRTNLTHSQIHNTSTPVLSTTTYAHSTTENSMIVSQSPMTQDTNLSVNQVLDTIQMPPIANIPVTDSMVQIINQIDNIIPKDIIRNVMDKDEMNEFIGDIEELIKEEITASPQTMDTANRVIDSLNVSQGSEILLHEHQRLTKTDNIPVTNSPVTDIAIEEIDSNTSNIADIIRNMTSEALEQKIVTETSDVSKNNQPEISQDITQEESSITTIVENTTETEVCKTSQNEEEILEKENVTLKNDENKIIETSADAIEESTIICKQEEKIDNQTTDNTVTELEMDIKLELEDESNLDDAIIQAVPEQVVPIKINIENECSTNVSNISEIDKNSIEKVVKEEKLPDEEVNSVSLENQNIEQSKIPVAVTESDSKDMIMEENVIKVEDSKCEEESQNVSQVKVEDTAAEISTNDENNESIPKVNIQIEVKDSLSLKEQVKSSDTETLIKETNVLEDSNSSVIEKVKEDVILTKEVNDEDKLVNEESLPSKDIIKEEVKEVVQENKKEEVHVVKQEQEEKVESEEEDEEELKSSTEVVKKENIESGEDTGEFYDEEPSISKINAGRAVKTYSKKQVVVDSETESEGNEGADYRTWKKAVMLVYNRLATHKYASVFLRPITEEQAPGYHSIIFRPMDLSTIKKNIENGTIRTTNHFKRDVMLMFQNAMMYNKQNTVVYQMAVSMQEECLEQMQILVQVTVEASFRRETRTAASISSDSLESGMKRKRSIITPSPIETENPRTKKYKKLEND